MWPLLLLWDMGLSGIIIEVLIGLIGLDLFFRVWRRKIYYVKVHDFSKGHSWCSVSDVELVKILQNFSFTKLKYILFPRLSTVVCVNTYCLVVVCGVIHVECVLMKAACAEQIKG
jgi:hypothetical protein